MRPFTQHTRAWNWWAPRNTWIVGIRLVTRAVHSRHMIYTVSGLVSLYASFFISLHRKAGFLLPLRKIIFFKVVPTCFFCYFSVEGGDLTSPTTLVVSVNTTDLGSTSLKLANFLRQILFFKLPLFPLVESFLCKDGLDNLSPTHAPPP